MRNAITRKMPVCLSILAFGLLFSSFAHARSPLDGRLRIVNERMAPVKISIDGERSTRLAPGERRVFRDVPNGVRLVEVYDTRARRRSSDRDTARVAVPINGVGVYRVEARFGQAKVINDSGVRMRLMVDGRELGVAAPGQAMESWPLRPGQYTVVARPAGRHQRHGHPISRVVNVRPGHAAPVRFGAWHGQVTVTNPFDFRAGLFVDGERIDRLAPGESRVLARQVPGAHRMQLKRRGRLLADTTVRVAPGQRAAWTPVNRRLGDLQVRNVTGHRVRVTVDGRDMGRLGAGESRTFTDLSAGLHTVAFSRRGRVIEERRVRIRAYDVAEVVAARSAGRAPHRSPNRGSRGQPAPIARR